LLGLQESKCGASSELGASPPQLLILFNLLSALAGQPGKSARKAAEVAESFLQGVGD
jgi:hypothetical protein